MKQAHYLRLASFFASHPRLKHLLCCLCRLLPAIVMLVYPVILFVLLLSHRAIPWGQIIPPALTLTGTIVLRRFFPHQRPFEVFSLSPLIPHKPGGSFPSRHSASALAIALVAFDLHPWAGMILTILAAIIGATRILTFLHFPRDVLAGYMLALILGLPSLLFF